MNNRITIILSPGLARIRLADLAGRQGIIAEDLTNTGRHNKGFMIMLDQPYLNECLWYVPQESIDYA